MEVVRQFIDAKKLMSVMQLPKTLQNSKLEIIVLPAEDKAPDKSMVTEKSAKVNSIVDSLVGIIPNNGMTLEDYRAERLSKYEVIN